MTSKNKIGSLNAEAQKFSNINSHWHLSYLRLKKNRYGMFGLYGVLFIFFKAFCRSSNAFISSGSGSL